MKIFSKLRRELLVGISKLGLHQARVYRSNASFKIPLINGMGRFLFVTNEPWRWKTLEVISKMDPKVIFDIGVNVGQTLLDAKQFMPQAEYLGFEPNPACIFYSNELIRLNQFKNTIILPFGLGAETGKQELYSRGPDDASSSIIHKSEGYSTVVYIKKGDEFVSEERVTEISFIKIDTEGYEFEVLKGLEKSIQKFTPIIFCEILSGSDENEDIYNFLINLGYEIFEQGSSMRLFKMSSKQIFNNPCHDYIFAPRNKSKEFQKIFNDD